jgi:hypothetical protein
LDQVTPFSHYARDLHLMPVNWFSYETHTPSTPPPNLKPVGDAVPGAITVHTFGDFQQFNPHLYLIATDGCFPAAAHSPDEVWHDCQMAARQQIPQRSPCRRT